MEDILVFDVVSRDLVYSVKFGSLADIPAGDFYIIDRNVLQHVGSLPNSVIVDATEELKSYAGIPHVLIQLINLGLKKHHTIVAIGGGITQDLTAHIAAIYMRGITWKFVPTTLLAMADSCIGSKSSINFLGYKNLIGTFKAPAEIVICTDFLSTLNSQDIKSGLAEIVKLFIIAGSSPQYIKERIQNITADLIEEALLIKKVYVEHDEFDTGMRKVLNYGHCFGHAIETATDYKIPHGIAVAMGMDIVNGISPDFKADYAPILQDLYRDYMTVSWDIETVLDAMTKDKKMTNTVNIIAPLDYEVRLQQYINDDTTWNLFKQYLKEFKDASM